MFDRFDRWQKNREREREKRKKWKFRNENPLEQTFL